MSTEQPRRKSHMVAVIECDGSDVGMVAVDFLNAYQTLCDLVGCAMSEAESNQVPLEHVNIRFTGADRWHEVVLSLPAEDAAVILERDQATAGVPHLVMKLQFEEDSFESEV